MALYKRLIDAVEKRNQHAPLIGMEYEQDARIDDIVVVPTTKEKYERFLNLYFDDEDWTVIYNIPDVEYEVIVFSNLEYYRNDGVLFFDRIDRVVELFAN